MTGTLHGLLETSACSAQTLRVPYCVRRRVRGVAGGERVTGPSPSGHGRSKDNCAVPGPVQGGEAAPSLGDQASGENTWPDRHGGALVPWLVGSPSVASEKPGRLVRSPRETRSASRGRARLQVGETRWQAAVRAQEEGGGGEPRGSGPGRGAQWTDLRQGSEMGLMDW